VLKFANVLSPQPADPSPKNLHPNYLISILILSHLNLLPLSRNFRWDFPIKIVLRLRSVFLAHLILLDLVPLPMLRKKYKLLSFLLRNFLFPPVPYCLTYRYFPQHPVYKHPQCVLPPLIKTFSLLHAICSRTSSVLRTTGCLYSRLPSVPALFRICLLVFPFWLLERKFLRIDHTAPTKKCKKRHVSLLHARGVQFVPASRVLGFSTVS
jgi:hypothetical protein